MTGVRYEQVWRVQVTGGPDLYRAHLTHLPTRKQHYAVGITGENAIDTALDLFWEMEPELQPYLPPNVWELMAQIKLGGSVL